jgi:hypothetical protein
LEGNSLNYLLRAMWSLSNVELWYLKVIVGVGDKLIIVVPQRGGEAFFI